MEKKNIELTVEEINSLINKVAQHPNVKTALEARDGEERLKIVDILAKTLPKENKNRRKKK